MTERTGGRPCASAAAHRRIVRPWLTVLLAWAALALALPRAAAAHTHLRESTPAAGETVAPGVRQVRLRFSEAVEPGFTGVTLTGPDGRTVDAGALEFPADGHGRVAVLPVLAPLAPGRWTVSWKAVAADGHPAKGAFQFVVQGAASASPPPSPAPPSAMAPAEAMAGHDMAMDAQPSAATETMHHDTPAEVAVRWLGLLALLAMAGSVAFHFAVVSPVRPAAPDLAGDAGRRAAGAGTWAVLLSLPVLVLRLWSESRAMNGAGLAMDGGALGTLVGGTAWGHAWLLQLAATLLFGGGILLARRGRSGGWAVAALAAVVLAGVPALSGHAAASDHATLAVAVDWLHVLGASAWLGTLFALFVAGIPACLERRSTDGAAGVALLVSRFSPFALAAAGLAAATGVASACLRLSAVAQLWTTDYGRTLLAKLALVAAVAAIGAWNWRVVRPSLGSGAATLRLRRSAAVELVVGALVVLATAVLVALPPP
jgi:putative copper export protein/methionine-rich copper-binding protein CopC